MRNSNRLSQRATTSAYGRDRVIQKKWFKCMACDGKGQIGHIAITPDAIFEDRNRVETLRGACPSCDGRGGMYRITLRRAAPFASYIFIHYVNDRAAARMELRNDLTRNRSGVLCGREK